MFAFNNNNNNYNNNNNRRVAVFGSTGSIGTQALEVAAGSGGGIVPVFLSCARRTALLREQVARFAPEAVCVMDSAEAAALAAEFPGVEVLTGARGLAEAASRLEFDVMLNALVGIAGLAPTLAFLGRRDASGRALALANKETLVTAGGIVMRAAQDAGVDVVPVDSEHSAIYQCLHGRDAAGVRRVLLTASGGPFRGFDEAQLRAVTPEQALAHPTWRMGAKITVDSATMMNKAFEVIEAKWLFGLAPEQVDVVIHPQSIVHSFVEFADGAMLAQLGTPSMTVPIAYAFYAPERRDAGAGRIDPAALGALLFEEPGAQARRSLDLAYAVLREAERGFDSPGIVMNAANEELVGLFLRKRIGFVDIIEGTERMLERHAPARSGSAEEIFALDRQVRQEIRAAFGAVEE